MTHGANDLIGLFSSPRKFILEIDALDSSIAQHCKSKFPKVRYTAFVSTEEIARDGLNIMDRVICGDFSEEKLLELGITAHCLDGIVLNNTLERLYDPWRMLSSLHPWLDPKAEVVARITNTRNLELLDQLVGEQFAYTRQHGEHFSRIRFFTEYEATKIFEVTGYKVHTLEMLTDERLVKNSDQHIQSAELETITYNNVGIRTSPEHRKELFCTDFLLQARPLECALASATPRITDKLSNFIKDENNALVRDEDFYLGKIPAINRKSDQKKTNSKKPQPKKSLPIDLFAFYLPQFHPTVQNSKWWGEGFTEWNNVTRAHPMFRGHYQPRYPEALGYYDLRAPEIMAKQVSMAKQAGLKGFIFYYYWFSGERMLEMPLKQYMDRQDELNFPFMVMWCNENWRRTWVDSQQTKHEDLLMSHKNLPDDPEKFIEDLHPILTHKNYVRVDGKPVLLVYPLIHSDGCFKEEDVPGIVARWRKKAREMGIGELWIGSREHGKSTPKLKLGVDFFFEFPPSNNLSHEIADAITGALDFYEIPHQIKVVHYKTLMEKVRNAAEDFELPLVRTVLAGSWDNTARKGLKANIFHGCTPALYERWLREAARHAQARPALPGKPMVFINAWNEWAEGVYLEPDRKFGYALLAATQRVACGLPPQG